MTSIWLGNDARGLAQIAKLTYSNMTAYIFWIRIDNTNKSNIYLQLMVNVG
jgi:hypothetical protein